MTITNSIENYPLVSVIIPTHNCLNYLKQAIESVRNQNYNNLEIIVVDDNSNDGTINWLTSIGKIDPRIKPFRINGKGVSDVRNFAISQSKGDYIAFLDADDLWRKDKLIQQIQFHQQNPDITLSFTNYEHFDMQGGSLGDCFHYWPHFTRLVGKRISGFYRIDGISTAPIFAENVIGTSTVIVRKNALQSAKYFDNEITSASDWDLWLRISEQGPIGYSPEVLMDYLVREGSISRKTELRLSQMKKIIHRYQRQLLFCEPMSVVRAYSRLLVGWAEHYRDEGNTWKALTYHLKALILSPSKRVVIAALSDMLHLSGIKH